MESLLCKFKKSLPNYSLCDLHNILILSFCVFQVGTVNLNKLKNHVGRILEKDIAIDSGYKRLIRVFDKHSFSCLWLDLLRYVFHLLRLQSDYLILDGTSWKHQGSKHHYMTLCILYKGISIPIYWVDLRKLGLSNEQERKKMFSRVFKHFNLEGKILLADREYIGREWFKYLYENNLDFVIRTRDKSYQKEIDACGGKTWEEMKQKVIRSKKPNKALRKRVVLQGVTYTFVIAKNPKQKTKDKVLYFLSTLDEPAIKIANRYLLRWKIECCFKHMKSNGFQLEQMNLNGKARPKLLMAIVVFAYVISVYEGLKEYHKVRTIKPKKRPSVKAISVFREGWGKLITKLTTIEKFIAYINQSIHYETNRYKSAKILNV